MATHGAIVSGPDAQVWRPLGQVLGAPLAVDWAASHASYPTAVPLGGDRVRVYFSPRDAAGRSCLASIELSIHGPRPGKSSNRPADRCCRPAAAALSTRMG
jgi:hypothetical protein